MLVRKLCIFYSIALSTSVCVNISPKGQNQLVELLKVRYIEIACSLSTFCKQSKMDVLGFLER